MDSICDQDGKSCPVILIQGMDNKDGKKKQGLNYEILLMKMKHEAEKQHDATERKRQCNHAHSTSSTGSDVSPPDGGWGWVVCFGSFLVNFILDGTMFSFGLILLELLEEFGESKAKTSWIGSALLGLSMILGPFVGWLLDRYSLRQVTIGGALVATSGFVASFFAPNITVLTLTYGVIGGIGFCMMFLPAILVVGLYFSRRRAIATGIAMSGSGLGTFAYAYICDILLTYYNWRGTVLVLAGLILNCAVCGAIFRPIRKRMIKDNKTSGLTNTLCHCCTCVENSEKSSTESHEKHFFLRRNEEQVEQNLYNSTSILDKSKLRAAMFPNLKFGSDIQREYSSDLNLTKKRVRTLTDPSNPLSRKDIYYSGSIQNLHHPSIQVTEIQSDCESDKCEKTRRKWSCLNSKSKTVDFSLFRNRKFVLLLQCMTLWTGYLIFFYK